MKAGDQPLGPARLDRPRTTDIDKLGFVGAVFLEQFEFMGDPERRIGVGEGAKGEAKLLWLRGFEPPRNDTRRANQHREKDASNDLFH